MKKKVLIKKANKKNDLKNVVGGLGNVDRVISQKGDVTVKDFSSKITYVEG